MAGATDRSKAVAGARRRKWSAVQMRIHEMGKERQEEAMLLRDRVGLTFAEIAFRLGVSRQRAHQLYVSGKARQARPRRKEVR